MTHYAIRRLCPAVVAAAALLQLRSAAVTAAAGAGAGDVLVALSTYPGTHAKEGIDSSLLSCPFAGINLSAVTHSSKRLSPVIQSIVTKHMGQWPCLTANQGCRASSSLTPC